MNLSEEEILNHSKLLVNVLSAELVILFWNKASELYFGVGKEEVLGKTLEEVFPGISDHPRMDLLYKALEGEYVFSDGVFDRTGAPYSQLIIPLKDGQGKIIAALNIVRPLSRQGARTQGIRLLSQAIF